MKRPVVLTAGGAHKQQQPQRIITEKDDDLSYDEEDSNSNSNNHNKSEEKEAKVMEKQMLLSPASNDDVADDTDEELAAQLDDLYNPETATAATSAADDVDDDKREHDGEEPEESKPMSNRSTIMWICICFFGIMFSGVAYGLLLEYATSGGRKLHELSFMFVTSLLYTCTAAAGRHVRDESPTTIPPARFAVLGITSMGSTFCSVRSLRYVCFFFTFLFILYPFRTFEYDINIILFWRIMFPLLLKICHFPYPSFG